MEELGGDLAEFGKKRNTDYDFPRPLCGRRMLSFTKNIQILEQTFAT